MLMLPAFFLAQPDMGSFSTILVCYSFHSTCLGPTVHAYTCRLICKCRVGHRSMGYGEAETTESQHMVDLQAIALWILIVVVCCIGCSARHTAII